MPKLSRNPLKIEDINHFTTALWSTLASLHKMPDIALLLENFFTHTEVKMFAKRLQIAKMLLDGNPYAVIRRRLHVTDAPIARISNLLNGSAQFKDLVRRLIAH